MTKQANEQTMNRNEAIKMARELRGMGTPNAEVAKLISERGYRSQRTGKAITMGAVPALVKASMRRRPVVRRSRPVKPEAPMPYAQVIKAIVAAPGMQPIDKLALIDLVVGT